MTWDQGVADPIPVRKSSTDERRRRIVVAVVVVVLVAVVVVVFAGGGSSRPEEPGAQVPVPSARVRGPGTKSWTVLVPTDGSAREGHPPAMVARGELICFGFGRDDPGAPSRPTVAHCVDVLDLPVLEPDEVASLVVVDDGDETWHLLMTGTEADSLRLVDASGEEVEPGRVHVDDDLVALRLARGQTLSELSWIAGRARVVCTPAPDAVESGVFCPGAT